MRRLLSCTIIALLTRAASRCEAFCKGGSLDRSWSPGCHSRQLTAAATTALSTALFRDRLTPTRDLSAWPSQSVDARVV